MSPYFSDAVFDAFQDVPAVTYVLGDGMMAAIDLASDKAPGVRGYDAQSTTFANGVLIIFAGDTGIIAPALICRL
jgi:Adenosylmethionine-8-amino-7-oxononanoate aminotransferase